MTIIFIFGILISLVSLIIAIKERDWGWGGFMLFIILISVSGIVVELRTPRTLRCERIEQIDTLYKNDSIVGFEITYRE